MIGALYLVIMKELEGPSMTEINEGKLLYA
jgi:hypothetical protein